MKKKPAHGQRPLYRKKRLRRNAPIRKRKLREDVSCIVREEAPEQGRGVFGLGIGRLGLISGGHLNRVPFYQKQVTSKPDCISAL